MVFEEIFFGLVQETLIEALLLHAVEVRRHLSLHRGEDQIVCGVQVVQVFDLAVEGHSGEVNLVELLIQRNLLVDSNMRENLVQLGVHLLHDGVDFGGEVLSFAFDIHFLFELHHSQQLSDVCTFVLQGERVFGPLVDLALEIVPLLDFLLEVILEGLHLLVQQLDEFLLLFLQVFVGFLKLLLYFLDQVDLLLLDFRQNFDRKVALLDLFLAHLHLALY